MSDLFFSDHGRNDMSLAIILALLAIFFGDRTYLAGWIRSPGKSFLTLSATLAGLALWMLWRWWQYR